MSQLFQIVCYWLGTSCIEPEEKTPKNFYILSIESIPTRTMNGRHCCVSPQTTRCAKCVDKTRNTRRSEAKKKTKCKTGKSWINWENVARDESLKNPGQGREKLSTWRQSSRIAARPSFFFFFFVCCSSSRFTFPRRPTEIYVKLLLLRDVV